MLRRVATFGVTLAQSTYARHPTDTPKRSMPSRVRSGSVPTRSGTNRSALEFLVRELPNPRPLIPPGLKTSPAVSDVLDTFRMIAQTPPNRSAATSSR